MFNVRMFVAFEGLSVLAFFLAWGLHVACVQGLSEYHEWNGMIDTKKSYN